MPKLLHNHKSCVWQFDPIWVHVSWTRASWSSKQTYRWFHRRILTLDHPSRATHGRLGSKKSLSCSPRLVSSTINAPWTLRLRKSWISIKLGCWNARVSDCVVINPIGYFWYLIAPILPEHRVDTTSYEMFFMWFSANTNILGYESIHMKLDWFPTDFGSIPVRLNLLSLDFPRAADCSYHRRSDVRQLTLTRQSRELF